MYLILDMSFIIRRHVFREHPYTFIDVPRRVISNIVDWKCRFMTTNFVFCFDDKPYKRREVSKYYKKDTHNKESQKQEKYKEVISISKHFERVLRKHLLYSMGFSNSLFFDGYEADDIIAGVCNTLRDEKKIIITADKDMYQLLDKNTTVFNPVKDTIYDIKMFENDYKIPVFKYPLYKSILGDVSDNVKGIYGVGHTTILRYIYDKMGIKWDEKKWSNQDIIRMQNIDKGIDLVKKNLRLITLPFEDFPIHRVHVKENKPISTKEWRTLGSNTKGNRVFDLGFFPKIQNVWE